MNDNIIPFKGAAAFLTALAAPAVPPRRDLHRKPGGVSPLVHHAYLSALATARCPDREEEEGTLPDLREYLQSLPLIPSLSLPANDG